MAEPTRFEAIAGGTTELRIHLNKGRIRARAGEGADWRLSWNASNGEPPQIARDGHVLRIERPGDGSSPDETSLGTALEVMMPLSVESVELRTDHGDIEAEGLVGRVALHSGRGDACLRHARGPARVVTGIGDVRLDDLEGDVVAHSGAGALRLNGWHGGPDARAELRTGAGDVEVSGTQGELNIQTGAGRVAVRVEGGFALEVVAGAGSVAVDGGTVRPLRVKTGAGAVSCSAVLGPGRHEVTTGEGPAHVTLPADARARIDAQTGWGRVHSDFPLVRVRQSGRSSLDGLRMVGTVGEDDPETHLQLRTDRGDVRISRAPAVADTTADRAQGHRWHPSHGATQVSLELPPMDLKISLDLSAAGRSAQTHAHRPGVDPQRVGATGRADPVLAILTAVARGEITPDQAEELLGSDNAAAR